jgi:hypothetical protein
MTAPDWQYFLDTVRSLVEHDSEIKVITPQKIAIINVQSVQACFISDNEDYSIRFERFGHEAGFVNYEPTPGSQPPPRKTLHLEHHLGQGESFWRLETQTYTTQNLARIIIQKFKNFYDEYKLFYALR